MASTIRPGGGLSRRRHLGLLLAISAWGAAPALAQLKSGDDPEASEVWKKVRASLFEQRPIVTPAEDVLQLEAPARAEDAAVVPIAIRTRFPQSRERYVDRLWLVIDNNPSPISAIFRFTPDSGRADIETRVRVDEYTHVRAIAETNDGKLYMTTRFVKASGGCSAPPGKDQAAALATLGRMKFRVEGEVDRNKPVLAQLMISHPNNSGLAMDQATRQYTPSHFVRRIEVSLGVRPLLTADVDFSISENPNFRFYFVPQGAGELKAEVVDSNDLRFESALKVQPAD
jgi:sulfur-oxidizing protein SoxY